MKPEVIIFGGHYRVNVSANGEEIVSTTPMSSSCLDFEAEQGASAVAVFESQFDYPVETQVFTSLNYGVPVYIGTKSGKFAIEGSMVRVLEQ